MGITRILNLYAGIGGNRKLWGDDHEITAVEYNEEIANIYKEFYPNDKVIIGDAHEYLLNHFKEFDFIWSSPPCQSHTQMMKATRHNVVKYADMKLYQEIILLQHFFKGKFVVENVNPYYKPLVPAQKIDRHLFWANFNIPKIKIKKNNNLINSSYDDLQKWIGIIMPKRIYINSNHCPSQVLRNCVHPEIGKNILDKAMNIQQEESIKQGLLF